MKIAMVALSGRPTPIALADADPASDLCAQTQLTGTVTPAPWLRAEEQPAEELVGTSVTVAASDILPAVPRPGTIICVGLNFREHIEEMGHPVPDHPTLFAKFAGALARPLAEVSVPPAMAEQVDYEGELAVIIGEEGRIAGYAVMNDVSQRDWQYRTQQWLQGKNLRGSSGFGPWVTTADEGCPAERGAVLRSWVNGELRQEHSLADLVFSPQELVDYIATFHTLEPGDVIITGTPEGVGHGMTPPQYLAEGDEVRVAIDGLGGIATTFRFPAE